MASGWDLPLERDAASSEAPRFVLLGELASGGMGSVDLVRMTDASGERVVAMKRMHPQFSRDAEFVQMFRDEIWLTQSLRHENIVQLIGWGEDDDGPYLVMEFVDGAPLAEIFYQGRRVGHDFPEELAAFVAARVADGLHAAHTLTGADGRPLELVHRDITPSNVLVGFDGSIKVTDFGIAKAADSGSHTRTGILKGKIEYMSPEHALKRPVDGRSDLYSLGIVLYELLSGTLPFHGGPDLQLLKRVVYEPVPPLSEQAPGVDPELSGWVQRLVAKNPEERPKDGAELARAFDGWLATRGLVREALEARLADHAARFGAARRRRLRKLMSHEGMELGSSSSWRDPKRVGTPAAPAPGTFTRAVSIAAPPSSAPLSAPLASAPLASAPLVSAPLASAPLAPAPPPSSPLASIPNKSAVASGVTRRVDLPLPARASAPPPPPVAAADPATRAHVRFAPYVIGIGAACLLVIVVVALSVSMKRTNASAAPPQAVETPAAEPTRAHTRPPLIKPPDEPLLPDEEPPESAEPASSVPLTPPPAPVTRKPAAGQRRPKTIKVPGGKAPPSRSKPCTPDHFDYPACGR